MAHLFMVESWVGANGRLLPEKIRDMGHCYTFVTRNPRHYGSDFDNNLHPVLALAEEIVVVETNDFARLLSVLENRHYDGIITICDYYIDTVNALSQASKLPCPFPERVKCIREKHLLRKQMDRAKLPNAKHILCYRWEELKEGANKLGYPLILKPVDLSSSAFVQQIREEEELRQAFLNLETFGVNFREQPREKLYLLEEYLDGPEFSVESILFNGEITTLGITDKSVTGTPYCIEDAHMFPAKIDSNTEKVIIHYVHEVLRKVQFHQGIAHTEVKLTREGPKIVEINPRPGGNYIAELVELVTGVDILKAFVELSLGIRPFSKISEEKYKSAAVAFLVPPKEGMLQGFSGLEDLKQAPNVYRWSLEGCEGKIVGESKDNAAYLGHLLAFDTLGREARRYAESALQKIGLRYTEV